MTDADRTNRALVDPNVVVYAHDPTDSIKHSIALTLLQSLSDAGSLIFSTQVLNEFCAVMVRPSHPRSLSADEAADVVADLISVGTIVTVTAGATIVALRGMAKYGLSFWDSMIWARAIENDIQTIYTEDEQSAASIEGVNYINPFANTA